MNHPSLAPGAPRGSGAIVHPHQQEDAARIVLDTFAPDVALAWARERYRDFELPDPLEACGRCHRHAAFYRDTEKRGHGFVCGVCGPRASLFTLPCPWYDRRQVAADVALKASGKHDLLGIAEPSRFEGDDG